MDIRYFKALKRRVLNPKYIVNFSFWEKELQLSKDTLPD